MATDDTSTQESGQIQKFSPIKLGGGHFRYPGLVRFHFDDIDDKEFGRACNLRGEIPFLNSPRLFQDALANLDPQMIDKLAWDTVAKFREFWDDETDDEIYSRLRGQVETIYVMCARFELDEQRRRWLVQFSIIILAADSFLDPMMGSAALGGTGEMLRLCEQLCDLNLVDSDTFCGLEALEKIRTAYQKITSESRALVPNCKEVYPWFAEECVSYFAALALTHDLEQDSKDGGRAEGAKFSQETLNEMGRAMSGNRPFLIYLVLLHGVRLSKATTMSLLFQISLNLAADIPATVNALVGLTRDIRLRQLDSPITYAVHHHGVPLQEAWGRTLARLHSLYHDYKLTTAKLLDIYRDEDDMAMYVRVVDGFLDGFLFYYTRIERYGNAHKCLVERV